MLSPVIGPDGRSYEHLNVLRWLERNACLPGSTIRVPNDWHWCPDVQLHQAVDASHTDARKLPTALRAGAYPMPPPPANKGAAVAPIGMPAAGPICFDVLLLAGGRTPMHLPAHATAEDLARAAQEKRVIPPDQQRFMCKHRRLVLEDTLFDSQIKNGSTVPVVTRLIAD